MGIFAGLVTPGNPGYTATKLDTLVPFYAGGVPTSNSYTNTTPPATGETAGVAPSGPYYSATTWTGPKSIAAGTQPVNHPPYTSDATFVSTEAYGQVGTGNPNYIREINGNPATNTGLFESLPVGSKAYTATTPNT